MSTMTEAVRPMTEEEKLAATEEQVVMNMVLLAGVSKIAEDTPEVKELLKAEPELVKAIALAPIKAIELVASGTQYGSDQRFPSVVINVLKKFVK